MTFRIEGEASLLRQGWGALLAAALLLILASCNVSNEEGRSYMNVAKDPSWDAYDTLEISWQDSAGQKQGLLFKDKPGKLQASNKLLAEGYQGQRITLFYKGFVSGTLVSEVRQAFDPGAPTLLKLDTVLAWDADLSALALTAGDIVPTFAPGRIAYSLSVANGISSTRVIAKASAGTSSIQVNGIAPVSGDTSASISLKVGDTPIAIKVTAANKTAKTYTVTVSRAADDNVDLSDLVVSAGALDKRFDPSLLDYSVAAPKESTSVTITPTAEAATSTIKVNGNTVASGKPSPSMNLSPTANVFRIVVTAQNNATRTYTVTVTQTVSGNANLEKLSLSAGVLAPSFSPDSLTYSLSVANNVTSTTVTPTVAAGKSTVKVKGALVTSGTASLPINLALGLNTIPVAVAAENGTAKSYTVFVTRLGPPKVMSAGIFHSLFIKSDGSLWATGANDIGQLGDSTKIGKSLSPVHIMPGSAFTQVAAGGDHSMMLKSDGTLWVTGSNESGQLGDGTTADRRVPVRIMAGASISQIAAGWAHSLVLKTDGTLWAMGDNSYGQLGDSTIIGKSPFPIQIMAGSIFTQIAAGGDHSMMLKSDGTLWAMGDNSEGQLGDGTTIVRRTPVQIMAGSTFTRIEAGIQFSLMIKTDGTLWGTGYNDAGELGDGTTTNRHAPVQIMPGSIFTQIAAGTNHSLFLESTGLLWAAGSNNYGQLGDGDTTGTSTPLETMSGTFSQIAAGGYHSLILKTDGTFWSVGNNTFGQLGDGTATDRRLLVQILR